VKAIAPRPTDPLRTWANGTRGFFATRAGGSELDLLELAGLSFLHEVIVELGTATDWQSLLVRCGSAATIEEPNVEGVSPPPDTVFRVEVKSLEDLRAELKAEWLARLDQSLHAESKRCRGLKSKRPRIAVWVESGYEQHELPMALNTFRRALRGQPIMRVRHYRYEGESYRGEWSFNDGGLWNLQVGYDDAGVGFIGSLADATVQLDRRT